MSMHVEELTLVVSGALVLIVAVAMIAGRINVATPLILVVVGVGIGYIPGVPSIRVEPEVILIGVLPLLLYAAAINVPVIDLRRNIGPITALSVALVIISAVVVGVLLHLAIPAIPLAAAIALGAVVAPTDAVAATAIGKRVGMPPRLVTILEGESLVNDATSLVLLRTAIAATAGSFVFWQAAAQFAFAVTVAIIIGLLIGIITVWVRSKLDNPSYDIVISFTVPFIAFLPTEYLGASGVLAVVIAGLYSGHHAPKKFSATARLNERLNWRTVQFLLENGVFLIMGFELHGLIRDIGSSNLQLPHTLLIGLCVVIVLILLRMAFMWPMTWSLARALPRYEARAATRQRRASHANDVEDSSTDTQQLHLEKLNREALRSEADATHARKEGLDRRGATILGWSGMRGVVTLAAAQSIPTSVEFRPQLVLIAFIVAVTTLLLHGLTLPMLISKLRPQGPSKDARREELLSLYHDLVEAGTVAVESTLEHDRKLAAEDSKHIVPSEAIVRTARSSVRSSLAPLAFSLPGQGSGGAPSSDAEAQAHSFARLARAAIDAQRATLLEEQAVGQYSSSVLRAATDALDQYETRLIPPHGA